jgi:hypothetical protein
MKEENVFVQGQAKATDIVEKVTIHYTDGRTKEVSGKETIIFTGAANRVVENGVTGIDGAMAIDQSAGIAFMLAARGRIEQRLEAAYGLPYPLVEMGFITGSLDTLVNGEDALFDDEEPEMPEPEDGQVH